LSAKADIVCVAAVSTARTRFFAILLNREEIRIMQFTRLVLTATASTGLLFLGACSGGNTEAAKEPPSLEVSKVASTSEDHGKPQAGGQVIESGPYHLEFVSKKEEAGTHLDFYLQKGDTHAPIADAKVTAQIQLPDGTQKSLPLKYDAAGKHYTAMFTDKAAGDYKIAMLSEIKGKRVNGRFNFKQ
jgi:hypothetical protein